jgi:pimeloyl-ACP methyl ester carboxylesterase
MALPLHCETSGDGPPVVCLHGFGLSSYSWREIRNVLAPSHTVHALDLKGFGKSPKPRDGRYSVRDQAAAVIDCLDRMQLRKIALVGHSLGGGIALVVALELLKTRPEMLKSLILLDAASYRQPMPKFMGMMRRPVTGALLLWILPPRVKTRTVLRRAYFAQEKIPQASIDAYARPLGSPGGRYALRQTAKQIVPDDLDDICARYPTIRVPTLIIWGAHDRIVPIAFGERLREAVPGARLVVIPEAGHMPHEESPDAVGSAIAAFLAGDVKDVKA